jgi:cyclic pyranopterin phosphate synthase
MPQTWKSSYVAGFHAVTRWGHLDKVLAGIDAAQRAGLRIKINTVALRGDNEDEIPKLLE